MRKTREILRLRWEKGLAMRKIARSLHISHSTVKDHLTRAGLAGLSWPLPEDMSDDDLEELAGRSALWGTSRISPTSIRSFGKRE